LFESIGRVVVGGGTRKHKQTNWWLWTDWYRCCLICKKYSNHSAGVCQTWHSRPMLGSDCDWKEWEAGLRCM